MPGAISKADLFERLAAGHAAGITVVTPNRRLAQVLKGEFDSYQTHRGLTVWEDADILPLSSYVERRYEDALYADGGDSLPMLLSPSQSRELWEEAIRGSKWNGILLDVPRTAKNAMDAWRLAQGWRIAGALEKFDATEDTRAFADWARGYARRLKKDGLTDAALLPDVPLQGAKPKLLVAYAFDILPTQSKDVIGDAVACSPEKKSSKVRRSTFASPREELDTAARWARARLEAGAKQVGVVIPDLEQRRREVARVFARVMGSAAPFNISIGEPLSGYPMVAFALDLLEFSFSEKPFEEVSRIIRSPFLAGAESEMAQRALLDARLRREAPATLTLAKLIGLIKGCPLLRAHLESFFSWKADAQSPQEWAERYTNALKAAGFPGERTLDSAEYQTQQRFNEVLGEFARLGLVSSRMNARASFTSLRRLCSETLFQPESGDAPVQVLGLLESAGLGFDALWVSGLTDDAWPLRSRPNPFLPVGLQRMAGIPESSAEGSLELDRRITEGWKTAADEVVFSTPRRTEDRDLSPSPLIAGIEETVVEVPELPSWKELIFQKRKTEAREDRKAPPVASAAVRGGTRVLADQAACPFRAFARWRLGAETLESPEQGPDAIDRGMLLHALMAGIWKEAKTIGGLSADLISRSARKAVQDLQLEGRFAQLEVERLTRLANEWLDLERARPAFEVLFVEKKQNMAVAGLELSGRIDRMDRLADGTHVILDYKTGSRVTSNDWLGPRPDDPQLPLYAVTAAEPVSALAFAKLRAGDMKFSGFSRMKDAIPGVKQAKSWEDLVEGWKKELGALAGGFVSGEAPVDPKRGLKTCQNCDLHPLCRVHEKIGGDADDDSGEGE